MSVEDRETGEIHYSTPVVREALIGGKYQAVQKQMRGQVKGRNVYKYIPVWIIYYYKSKINRCAEFAAVSARKAWLFGGLNPASCLIAVSLPVHSQFIPSSLL